MSKPLDVEIVKAKCCILEVAIAKLLNKFSQETGCFVGHVSVQVLIAKDGQGYVQGVDYLVETEVRVR